MLEKYYKIIKSLFHILLVNNPKFFFKRIFLELESLVLPIPESPVSKRINGILFEFDFGYSHKIKKMYFNTYEASVVEVLRSYLKKGDK